MPGFVHVLDPYHGIQRGWDSADEALRHIEEVIQLEGPHTIAAFILESVTGTNGILVPPDGYMQGLRALCDKYNILLICDEVMCGFGRTGEWFAVNHWNVVPDIMTVGKGVGGGFPLAGVVSTDKLTSSKPWSNPSFSSSSYGGNPLASAAGLAALEIILKEDLVKNADRVGAVMLTELMHLKEKYRAVGEVRGRGLLLGIELVEDRQTRKPLDKAITRDLYMECLRRGLVSMTYSPTIRINPPLVISEETARAGLAILDEALGAVLRRHGRD